MLYKRGRIWWVEFEHAGDRYQLTTGQTDRRLAEKRARKIRVEIEEEAGPGGRRSGVELELLRGLDIARTEQQKLGDRREETVDGLWAPLLRFFGNRRDVSTISLADVDTYEGERRQKVRGQTVRREVQALVRGLRLAKRAKMIRSLPFDPDDLRTIASDPPLPAQQAKEWSALEITKVLDRLSAKAKTAGIRDQMRLVQLTGLRFTELKRLRWSWLKGNKLHVPAIAGAKTKQGRPLPLAKEAIDILKKWRHEEGDAPLFARGKPNKALKDASRRAKMSAVLTPRDVRAWYITHAGKQDPVAAQKLAGHTSIKTTSRYLHADERRMLAAARAAAEAAEVPTAGSRQRKAGKQKAQ